MTKTRLLVSGSHICSYMAEKPFRYPSLSAAQPIKHLPVDTVIPYWVSGCVNPCRAQSQVGPLFLRKRPWTFANDVRYIQTLKQDSS